MVKYFKALVTDFSIDFMFLVDVYFCVFDGTELHDFVAFICIV